MRSVVPAAESVGEQADDAIAERSLDRELGQRAAGQGQSAEAERQHRRREQRRPQAARGGHGGDADGQEQAPFTRT